MKIQSNSPKFDDFHGSFHSFFHFNLTNSIKIQEFTHSLPSSASCCSIHFIPLHELSEHATAMLTSNYCYNTLILISLMRFNKRKVCFLEIELNEIYF